MMIRSALPPATTLSVVVFTPVAASLLRFTSQGSETVMLDFGTELESRPPIMAEAMLPPPMKARVLCWRAGIVRVCFWFSWEVERLSRVMIL
jgi:hypothetical protein